VGNNRNDGDKTKLHVLIEPNIGLDGDTRHSVVKILNTILADEAVMTLKTLSAHWHVRGPGFLDLRTLFGQQVHQLQKISDEISERIRMLDGFAIGSFVELLNATRLKEKPGEVPDFMDLLADHEASIRFMRDDARRCFEEYEDHGTFTLFVRFIRMHEKMAWILRSYIEPEITPDEIQGNKVRSNLR